MLTYRIGSAGGLSGARAMTAHLLEPTLPPELAQVAAYYARTPGAVSGGLEVFASTIPRIREDLDPRLSALLRLDPQVLLDPDAIAYLLAGRRADGRLVGGRTQQGATLSLAAKTGLAVDRLPTAEELGQILDGRHAGTGEPLPTERAAGLQSRLLRLYGADHTASAADVVAAVAEGDRADGRPLRPTSILEGLTASRTPVRFVDLCFSADKTLSIAWAFAGTDAERALLHAVHRHAVSATMRTIEATLGRARRGKGGRGGYETGSLAWLAFDHFTSRPTTEIAIRDSKTGEAYTYLATVRIAGTPQVHTHVCCLGHVLTGSGHIGTVDLSQLQGRVHEWGALYQARVATGLRQIGIDTKLNSKTGAAYIVVVPEHVRAAFSRRTTQGEAAARAYACDRGLDWDSLDASRRISLLKQGVQGNPTSPKVDDLGDLAAWRYEATSLGWQLGPLSNLDTPIPLPDHAERVEIACVAAAPLLADAFQRNGVVAESVARTAAARGLVAAGIADAAEIDVVTRTLLEHGIDVGGTHTPLVTQEVLGPYGKTKVQITIGARVGHTFDGEGAKVSPLREHRVVQEDQLVILARAGRAATVLDTLRYQGRARLAPGTLAEATEGIVDLWQERVVAIGENAVLVLAATREDCRAVSLAIRQRKRRMGHIGPDIAVLEATDEARDLYSLPIAVGDRVRLYGRTHARGAGPGQLGVNGSIVEIRGLETEGLMLRGASGRVGLVPWNALRDRETGRIKLGPGDGQTLSAAQTVTTQETILALPMGSEGIGARLFCMGLTRHRTVSWLVLGEAGERRAIAAQGGRGIGRQIREVDIWNHAAANLSRRSGSEEALELRNAAVEIRRMAEDGFRHALARMEVRNARGAEPTNLPAQGRHLRLTQALRGLEAGVERRGRAITDLVARNADTAARIWEVSELKRPNEAQESIERSTQQRARI